MRRRIPHHHGPVPGGLGSPVLPCPSARGRSPMPRHRELEAAGPRLRRTGRRRGAAGRSQKMEWILKQWEQQSQLLKTLDVRLLRIDDTPAWGDKEFYEGRALFQSPNLALIDFNKVKQDENKRPIKDAKRQFRLHPLRANRLHGQGGLAVSQRHAADLHLPAARRMSRRRPSRRDRCRSSSTCAPRMPSSATR